ACHPDRAPRGRPHLVLGDVQGRPARGLHLPQVLAQHHHRVHRGADPRARRAAGSLHLGAPGRLLRPGVRGRAPDAGAVEDVHPRGRPVQVLHPHAVRNPGEAGEEPCGALVALRGGAGAPGGAAVGRQPPDAGLPGRQPLAGALHGGLHRRVAHGVRRGVEGRAGGGVRDLQVLSQPRRGAELGDRDGVLHHQLDLHRHRGGRLLGGHHRDVQDLLLPQQAPREVRRQAHPVPQDPGAALDRGGPLRLHLGGGDLLPGPGLHGPPPRPPPV
ncbi:MAG: hypothetical protein AVDCRST_MAG68-4510, partial [uncultured Gemmatimonadetes bacterium]